MPQPWIFRKEGNHLVPAEPWTSERLDDLPEKKDLKAATLTQSRSLPFHNFYWAILSKICKATEIAPTAAHLHKALLRLCKYVTSVYDINGRVIELVPDSTAFEKMGQEAFSEYVEHAKRALAEHVGVNWDDYI